MTRTAVIVGSSVAGVRTAQALRAGGYPGSVIIVGAEPHLPYDKPPLSKSVLADEATDAPLLMTREEAEADDITLRLGQAAVALDALARTVTLADGGLVAFDELVIATGARARTAPWAASDRVHTLRTLDDTVRLRAALLNGGPLLVIGAGFIGCEVAATAKRLGVDDIEIVEPTSIPMSRSLDVATANLMADLHRRHGIRMTMGVGVQAIDPDVGGDRVVVELDDGSTRAVAAVLVGIGSEPETSWLDDSGLGDSANLTSGVSCDEGGRVVGQDRIYAIGDVAAWRDPRTGVRKRAEHWTNAVNQASVVAHNILHPEEPRVHTPVSYVWSNQHDWMLQLIGSTGPDASCERVRLEGIDPERSSAVLHGDANGRFVGAEVLNWPRAVVRCRQALSTAAQVPLLADVASGLAEMTGRAPAVHESVLSPRLA